MKNQPLTHREIEVVDLLTRGFQKKEVAYKLKISINTVRVHAANAYEKLEVTSIGQLCHFWNENSENEKKKLFAIPEKFMVRSKRQIRKRQYA